MICNWLVHVCARSRLVDLQKIGAVLQVRPPLSLSLCLLQHRASVSLTLCSLSGRLPPVSRADIEVICSWEISAAFCLFLATSSPSEASFPCFYDLKVI